LTLTLTSATRNNLDIEPPINHVRHPLLFIQCLLMAFVELP
jgi:hypothetical protein